MFFILGLGWGVNVPINLHMLFMLRAELGALAVWALTPILDTFAEYRKAKVSAMGNPPNNALDISKEPSHGDTQSRHCLQGKIFKAFFLGQV